MSCFIIQIILLKNRKRVNDTTYTCEFYAQLSVKHSLKQLSSNLISLFNTYRTKQIYSQIVQLIRSSFYPPNTSCRNFAHISRFQGLIFSVFQLGVHGQWGSGYWVPQLGTQTCRQASLHFANFKLYPRSGRGGGEGDKIMDLIQY